MTFAATPWADSPWAGDIEAQPIGVTAFQRFLESAKSRPRFLIEIDAVQVPLEYLGDAKPFTFADQPFADLVPNEFEALQKTFFFADGPWIGKPGDSLRRNAFADARVRDISTWRAPGLGLCCSRKSAFPMARCAAGRPTRSLSGRRDPLRRSSIR